jgi:hypothetical protein
MEHKAGMEAFKAIVRSKSREELMTFREQYQIRLQLIDERLEELAAQKPAWEP